MTEMPLKTQLLQLFMQLHPVLKETTHIWKGGSELILTITRKIYLVEV